MQYHAAPSDRTVPLYCSFDEQNAWHSMSQFRGEKHNYSYIYKRLSVYLEVTNVKRRFGKCEFNPEVCKTPLRIANEKSIC